MFHSNSRNNCLGWKLANFFHQHPGSKYFRICGARGYYVGVYILEDEANFHNFLVIIIIIIIVYFFCNIGLLRSRMKFLFGGRVTFHLTGVQS